MKTRQKSGKAEAAGGNPGKFRLALASWLGVWPVLTGLSFILTPLLQPWPLAARTLVTSAIMVPVMIFGVMPAIERLLSTFTKIGCQPQSRS
ncbi:hypothetical protein SAMN02745824_0376 [Parasphingorhabdus marina DSM 22363]|uniref:Uncharacterized protein n=1 Tax=Parasphingorhabdus marina DSM 22363 TaxID=1123272 RepID=A0A1N6CN15_9SPHN|nr:hypothetical protein [Parasphingorhabdus marina]SIN59839.1 hypothetical protein SAMN02745824_0376 [Parasphingorhabdus marina DSM 22363]